jgi:PAS domain-containing protein
VSRFEDSHAKQARGSDFVRRNRYGSMRNAVLFFSVGIAVALTLMFYPNLIAYRPLFIGLFVAVLSVPLGYTLYAMQRNLDIVMGIEFQNALFSSALYDENSFHVILNQEGTVVFNDSELVKFFPNISQGNLIKSLITIAGLTREESDRIYKALDNYQRDSFSFSLRQDDGSIMAIHVTLKPLNRPRGYFLIQGRMHVAKRVDREAPASVSLLKIHDEVTAKDIVKLLHSAPMGMYVIGADDRICFVDAMLELALGYQEGEIVHLGMTLADVRYVTEYAFARDENWAYLEERAMIHGRVMLKRKNGSLLKAMLRQEVAYRDDGSLVMLIGIVDIFNA